MKVLCILAATMASKLEKRATILILTGLDTFKPQEVLSTDWQSIKMVKKKKKETKWDTFHNDCKMYKMFGD